MNSKRMFYVLSGCLVILAGLCVSSVVLGNSLLKKSATKLNDLKLETNVIDEQQNSLSQAKRDIEKYTELEQIANSIVPKDKDQAKTVREIIKFGSETGVPIASISFPNSELGSIAAPTTGTGATAQTAPPVSQVKPVEGIKGIYQLELTIQNDKDTPTRYPALISFLKKAGTKSSHRAGYQCQHPTRSKEP